MVLLSVILVVLVAGYFFLQQYAVVTDEGVRFDVPFFRQEEPTPPPTPSVQIETPPVIVTTTPTPEPTPTVTQAAIHAVSLPRTALYDDTAQTQVEAAGGDAALFDMKGDDGTLGYVSELALAKAVKASDSNPAINAAIRSLTGGDLYTVARVSCFRDNTAPYRNNTLAIKTNSGYNWKDTNGTRWLSPTNEAARQYVVEVCVELARLGFDEILLDHAGYPTAGRLDYIKVGDAYDSAQFSAVVAAFYQQVKTALAGYPDVTLSIRTTEGALDGTDRLSGQTTANLSAAASRIWVAPAINTGTDYAGLLTAAGFHAGPETLVLTGVSAENGAGSWAILD